MQKSSPEKTFIPAPPNNLCACNECPHMKLNTLDKLYNALLYELPEIQLEESLRLAAKIPMDRMMEISKKAGLVG
jgi:quinolinate synthase